MLEPVLGEGGVLPLDDAFVDAAAEIAREIGALLVLDEVQAGIGRTGTFFAFEQLGIEPDLVTLAKGLGNGLPIGALLVREGVAEAIGPGDHGSTFGGNPVACAAACAVVEAIDEPLLENVAARGAQLAAGLAGLAGVREVRGRGFCWRRARPRRRRGGRRGARARADRPHGWAERASSPAAARRHRARGRRGARAARPRPRMSNVVRQQAILRLVRDRALSTQAELVDALREEGHDAVERRSRATSTSSGS